MNDPNENRYTAFFCEENIWQLAKKMSLQGAEYDELDILFFINRSRSVLLFEQMAAEKGSLLVWDYHVVLLNSATKLLYDFDTRLGFPCGVAAYFRATFVDQSELPTEFQTTIRKISSSDYLSNFDSDRSHMLSENGTSIQPFPDWEPIRSAANDTQKLALNQCVDSSVADPRFDDQPAFEFLRDLD